MLLICRAGSAKAQSELRRAVRLDEVLLGHHHRFYGHQLGAVVAHHVQRVGRNGVSLLQHHFVVHAAGAGALLVPAARAAAAERVDQAAVPTGGMHHEVGLHVLRRIEEHRNLIHAAINRARLDANDEWRLHADRGRGHCDVGRKVVQIGQRFENADSRTTAPAGRRNGGGRLIDVVDARRNRAVGIKGFAGDAAGHQPELVGLADERLLVRAGDDRPGVRVIDDRQLRRGLAGGRDERVASIGEPLDERHQRAARRIGMQRARDVAAVQGQVDCRGLCARRHRDAEQNITGAHELGLRVRDDVELESLGGAGPRQRQNNRERS